MPKELLKRVVLALLFLFLFFGGLFYAGGFLKPLAVAMLIAFILLPVGRFFERKGLKRGLSTTICAFLVVLILSGIGGLVTYQGSRFGDQYTELKDQASETFNKITKDVSGLLGLSQDELVKKVRVSASDNLKSVGKKVSGGFLTSMTDLLLILVYIVLFLYYRTHIKKFFIKLFKDQDRGKVVEVMEEAIEAALHYLRGKVILIGILAVCYSLGLFLIGVKFGIFYGVLAALLSIIPFIGNIIGGGLPILTALLIGDTTSVLWIIGLFMVVQVIESYVLTPLIVGTQVNLHPMMTILIVILSASVWGVVGMIVSIPFLGITMIVFQYIPKMEPYVFLLKQPEDANN